MNNGYIALHRKILEWEWFSEPNTLSVFLYCLMKANFKEKTWRGITVKRGEFITSISNISKETGVSIKSVRTALHRLILTNEVAKESNSQHTKIIVKNYNLYQSGANEGNDEGNNEGQSKGKQRATTNNVNNVNKEINNIAIKVLDYMNSKRKELVPTAKGFGKSHLKEIQARIKEGASYDEMIFVIENKSLDEWFLKDNCKLFRPSTLFSKKNYNNYSSEAPRKSFEQADKELGDWLRSIQDNA